MLRIKAFLLVLSMSIVLAACKRDAVGPAVPTARSSAHPSAPVPTQTTPVPGSTTPAAATPVGTAQGSGLGELNQFSQSLADALVNQNLGILRYLMGSSFRIAGWHGDGRDLTTDQAFSELQNTYLVKGSKPAVNFSQDVVALLKGTDPLALMSRDGVRAFYVTGLGLKASDEAVMIVAHDPTSGKLYWSGMLVAAGGFANVPADANSTPGAGGEEVKSVKTLDVLNLRSGPGTSYDSYGLMDAATVLQVIGKSSDGEWWQVECVLDAKGECWVSADPELTEPVNP